MLVELPRPSILVFPLPSLPSAAVIGCCVHSLPFHWFRSPPVNTRVRLYSLPSCNLGKGAAKGSGVGVDLKFRGGGAAPSRGEQRLVKISSSRDVAAGSYVLCGLFFYSANVELSVERLPCVLGSGNLHIVPVSLALT